MSPCDVTIFLINKNLINQEKFNPNYSPVYFFLRPWSRLVLRLLSHGRTKTWTAHQDYAGLSGTLGWSIPWRGSTNKTYYIAYFFRKLWLLRAHKYNWVSISESVLYDICPFCMQFLLFHIQGPNMQLKDGDVFSGQNMHNMTEF